MASKAETIRSIRAEYKNETGEDPGASAADVLLDRMCEAFFQKSQAEGLAYAVRSDMRTAKYLMWVWLGAEGKALRAAIDAADSPDGAWETCSWCSEEVPEASLWEHPTDGRLCAHCKIDAQEGA